MLRSPRMSITRSSTVLTWQPRIDIPSLSVIPRSLTALLANSTGNDCSSCVFRHSGGRGCRRKIYRGFSCRDLVAESVRVRFGDLRAHVREPRSRRKVQRCTLQSRSIETPDNGGIILLIKANPLLHQMVAMVVVPFARSTPPGYSGVAVNSRAHTVH